MTIAIGSQYDHDGLNRRVEVEFITNAWPDIKIKSGQTASTHNDIEATVLPTGVIAHGDIIKGLRVVIFNEVASPTVHRMQVLGQFAAQTTLFTP